MQSERGVPQIPGAGRAGLCETAADTVEVRRAVMVDSVPLGADFSP